MRRLQKVPELKPIAYLAEVACALRSEGAAVVGEELPGRLEQLCRRLQQSEAKDKLTP
jgi:hypothetical protein